MLDRAGSLSTGCRRARPRCGPGQAVVRPRPGPARPRFHPRTPGRLCTRRTRPRPSTTTDRPDRPAGRVPGRRRLLRRPTDDRALQIDVPAREIASGRQLHQTEWAAPHGIHIRVRNGCHVVRLSSVVIRSDVSSDRLRVGWPAVSTRRRACEPASIHNASPRSSSLTTRPHSTEPTLPSGYRCRRTIVCPRSKIIRARYPDQAP